MPQNAFVASINRSRSRFSDRRRDAQVRGSTEVPWMSFPAFFGAFSSVVHVPFGAVLPRSTENRAEGTPADRPLVSATRVAALRGRAAETLHSLCGSSHQWAT